MVEQNLINLTKEELHELSDFIEAKLISNKIKYIKSKSWREKNIPNKAGIYLLFDDIGNILYVGESGNLHERISELGRTVNHTFRKQIGYLYFGGVKNTKKFDNLIESKIDKFFEEKIYISSLEVSFGRLEIETYLVSKNQKTILNSVKKRK